MWRLKTSQGGGEWMQTLSGFHGRQVWEFDPDAGTEAERAAVERVRREFTENRFRRKESRDLLMRMQFTGLKHLGTEDIPGAAVKKKKLEDGDEVTEEVVLAALRRGLDRMSSLQADDGHWPGDYSGIMYLMPFWVFALHVTGSTDAVLSTEHKREICRFIYNHQNDDGGWGFNILDEESAMFSSCVNYITLRLLGEVPEEEHDGLAKGRAWILSHGTAAAASQWGKILLAVIGVYDWSGNNPIVPELWLLPRFLPIHPGRFWCFTRITYMSIAFLYAKRFVGPITPTILALRNELYSSPYENVDWSKARNTCAKEDMCSRPSTIYKAISTCLNITEPVLNCWPMNKLREKALSHIMEHIHYEDETTQYVGLCPVTKALNMICCWVDNPNSDAFKRHLPRIHDYLWVAEDGMKTKIYDGCQNWEIAFIVQAFLSTDLVHEYGPTIDRAYKYIKKAQITRNPPGDQRYWFRHRSKGSWALSTVDNGWASSDTTAEAFKAMLLLSKIYPNLFESETEKKRMFQAIDCLLSFMNEDGSVSTFELQRTYSWLEILNPLESFRNLVVDYPTVECTSSVMQALILFVELYPGYRHEEIREYVNKAAVYIENNQKKDGSWYGTWGICFIYGTLYAIKGLLAAGRTYENSICIRKACDFLLSTQLRTGGWGESYLSCKREVYVQGTSTNAVNTAWAMLALIYAGQMERDQTPLCNAAKVLINMQLETGEFPRQEHVGNTNSSVYFDCPNYRNLYPIWALGMYQLYPGYRHEEIREYVNKAAVYIENNQKKDGSWYGTWGICFTYGTLFAIKGLLAAGRTYENSICIRKACDFLLSTQLRTGGWGESYLSCKREVYVQGTSTNAVNTAWAMLALIYAGQMERDQTQLCNAAKVLINMQLETGEFPQQEHVGSSNSSIYFDYPNFRNLYPIWALGTYRKRILANKT